MNIEFQPSMEYENPIIVSADMDSASETEYGPIGIAKMGSSPGGFRYDGAYLSAYVSIRRPEPCRLLADLQIATRKLH
jgi:hypothetical protein